jgi:hypothetical protein
MRSTEEQRQRYEDWLELAYDLSKHLTTLGTVTAVLIAGLYKESFAHPPPPLLLIVTLILLAITVALALAAMTFIAQELSYRHRAPTTLRVLFWGAVAALLGSVISFAVYALF